MLRRKSGFLRGNSTPAAAIATSGRRRTMVNLHDQACVTQGDALVVTNKSEDVQAELKVIKVHAQIAPASPSAGGDAEVAEHKGAVSEPAACTPPAAERSADSPPPTGRALGVDELLAEAAEDKPSKAKRRTMSAPEVPAGSTGAAYYSERGRVFKSRGGRFAGDLGRRPLQVPLRAGCQDRRAAHLPQVPAQCQRASVHVVRAASHDARRHSGTLPTSDRQQGPQQRERTDWNPGRSQP